MADSIITQVKKGEEHHYNNGDYDDEEGGYTQQEGGGGGRKYRRTNVNLFRSLFSCCYPKQQNQTPRHHPTGGNGVRQSFSNNGANASDYPYDALLPPQLPEDFGRKTLVLDLDETLVHSSFKPINNADFIIPVEIEDQVHQVYVLKRPGVDKFMKRVGELFEVVIFTASLAKYADPVLDLLDKYRVSRARLFREACVNHKGNFVKDLSRLGRDLRTTIIIDNSPASYLFHPHHAVPIDSWFDDMSDTELLDMLPFLEELTKVDDVVELLAKKQGH